MEEFQQMLNETSWLRRLSAYVGDLGACQECRFWTKLDYPRGSCSYLETITHGNYLCKAHENRGIYAIQKNAEMIHSAARGASRGDTISFSMNRKSKSVFARALLEAHRNAIMEEYGVRLHIY